MSHMDLLSMSSDSNYRRSIELDLEADSDVPFRAELSSSLRSIKQKISRKFTSPENLVQDKINKISLSTDTPENFTDSPSSFRVSSEGDDEEDEFEMLDKQNDEELSSSLHLTRRRKQVPIQSSLRSLNDSFRMDSVEDEDKESEMCDETRSLLLSTLSEHFLFSELQESELENMVRVMKRRSYKANQWIIRRGEKTSESDGGLFVVGLNSDVLLRESEESEEKSDDDQEEKRLCAGTFSSFFVWSRCVNIHLSLYSNTRFVDTHLYLQDKHLAILL